MGSTGNWRTICGRTAWSCAGDRKSASWCVSRRAAMRAPCCAAGGGTRTGSTVICWSAMSGKADWAPRIRRPWTRTWHWPWNWRPMSTCWKARTRLPPLSGLRGPDCRHYPVCARATRDADFCGPQRSGPLEGDLVAQPCGPVDPGGHGYRCSHFSASANAMSGPVEALQPDAASAPPKGRLKVFLGYAAGVGKTYQMLDEAQELRRKGVDVAVGYFEP